MRADEHVLHWMVESLCDITLCLSKQGVGTDFLLHKFGSLPAILVNMLRGKDSKFDPFMTLLLAFFLAAEASLKRRRRDVT